MSKDTSKMTPAEIVEQVRARSRQHETPVVNFSQMTEIVIAALYKRMDSGEFSRKSGTWDGSLTALEGEVMDIMFKLSSEGQTEIPREKMHEIKREILADFTAFGPLSRYLEDPTVTEIMVNGSEAIFVAKEGELIEGKVKFRDEEHVREIADRLLMTSGQVLSESQPFVDARLPDGSQVNVLIPPVSVRGTFITIRKQVQQKFTMDDLINMGTLNKSAAEFLRCCVRGKINIIVSGGTGSGKTTLLSVLANDIAAAERIITIEDSAELDLPQKNVATLEIQLPDEKGEGGIVARDLMRNALRMRPDRIIIGEVRGAEAVDMLQAMNTGHDGSMATIHSNSPRDTLSRIETMIFMGGVQLPLEAIRGQIASACQLVVHMERFPSGQRFVTRISEIQGMEKDMVTLQDLFAMEREGLDDKGKVKGNIKSLGLVPKFMDLIKKRGVEVPNQMFTKK